MNNKKTAVVRSAIGSLSSVGFLKFLEENGFYLAGADISDECVGRFFTDSFFKVPKAEMEEQVWECYRKIVLETSAEWIISGPENEISVLAKKEKMFADMGCTLFHPSLDVLETITDKMNFYEFAYENGILTPRTVLPDNPELKSMDMPLILKPRKGRGSTGIEIFNCIPENFNPLDWDDYIVQEFIEGQEYTVDILTDMEGRLLNCIPRRRIKVDSGITVIGKVEKNKELIGIIESLVEKISFKGALCIQFFHSEKDGRYYLTDVNPRFGGGSFLSVRSSESFQRNIVNLLKSRWDKLEYNNYDFKELSMYRYYSEVFI
ncbi:MAG: ATP-grasp domain-containing protein [Desulforegulaceae bacterium]|nr:ATP-grasp domain-containing protein [Desulforegulaceae bacterium]